MQYTVAVAAAFAAVANAQMDMPMPASSPAPAASGAMPGMDMPMSSPAPAAPAMPPMGASMGMGGMTGDMPKFDNTTLSGQCHEIAVLSGFTKFAANETLVNMAAMMVPLSSDQVAQLQANATMANSKLMEIESNQTLSNTCAEVNQVTVPCMEYAGLTKLEDLAQNDTKIASLQQKKNLTDAQVTSLKSFAASEVDNLDMMNNNITLVTMCMDLKTNMMGGMSMADAALKAHDTALPMDAPDIASGETGTTAKGTTMAAKSAASAMTASSFLAAAGVAVGIMLFA